MGQLITAALTALVALMSGCGERATKATRADGELVVLLPRAPEVLDPRQVFDAYGLRISRLLFASLVTIDPHTVEPVPDLAEKIETPTPTTYRVTLREGLRFADGSTLDSRDVIATFESVRDPKMGSRYARTYQRIVSMKAESPRTVVFELDAPHAPFITDLELPILRAEDRARAVATMGGEAPVGAGPYVLVSRTDSQLVLAPNPHWYAGKPRTERLRFVVVRDDNTRALRMLAGGGDVVLGAMPPILLPLFGDRHAFRVERAPGIGTSYLGFNLEHPILRDVRVRQAIAHAIDRDALVRAKLGGWGRVANGWIPEGHWASVPDQVVYSFDPAHARQVLDEAGLRDPDGEGGEPRARFVLRTSTERSRVSVCQAIAAMLRNVGLEVEVQPVETATLLSDLGRGRFDMTLMTVPEVIEPHVLSWFFGSDRVPGKTGDGANRWRYRSRTADAAFERGQLGTSRVERRQAYADVQAILAKDLPVFPLWHEDVVLVRRASAPAFAIPRDGRFGIFAR